MKTRSQTAPPNKASSYANGSLKEDVKKDQSQGIFAKIG